MSTFVVDDASVTIPASVVDLDSFRDWLRSDEFPESGRISFYHGQVWVNRSKEQIFSHNQVKNEIAFVLTGLSKRKKIGRYFPDGVYLSNPDAGLSCQPDGVFVLRTTLDAGRIRLIEGSQEGFVELEGSPDLVIEIVSRGSVEKDAKTMLDLYWQADIEEYWLVDARGTKPQFTIYQSSAKGFAPLKSRGGWTKSRVLGESFRLTATVDERGDPEFTLNVGP
jgi:Uma2 family endonuclease